MGLFSAAELEGLHVFGGMERVVHGKRFYQPAVGGNAVRALLRLGTVESEEKVARVFAEMGVDTPLMQKFLEVREVARLPEHMGGGLEVRPSVPGVTDDALSKYAESDAGYEAEVALGADPIIDAAPKKYKLNNLFRDTTLADKLQISARRMQSARRLAMLDPSAAAAGLTDYIREHGFPNACVLAGDYARTVGNAIDFIRSMGNTIVYSDSAAPAVVSHTHLEVSFDQFHLRDVIWTVRGPLKYATEVNIIYQLAIQYGPEHVLFLLGAETLRLGIDIRNEKTGDYYTGALHGYSSLSGILPGGFGFPSELTADQQARLLIAGRKVLPVYADGVVIGSAVHVSDKHVILNEHTLTTAVQAELVPVVGGTPVMESMSVGGDICVIRRDSAHAQWHFRDPDVGERVVLCYSVGDQVEYSEVLHVLGSADQLILSDSNILRRGASGAAVIALRDSALLGIFSTKRATRVVCAPFTSASFAIVSDCQSVVSTSQYAGTPGVDAGDRTYAKMVRRGFLGFLEGIERAVAPLYSTASRTRRTVGLVANVDGEWHTTVDPNHAQLSMADNKLLSFRRSPFGTYVVDDAPPVLQALPNTRVVEPGERVFVFTKVDEDVIMSSVRVVSHVHVDRKTFVVDDFGETDEVMIGGLIVAERDAAVVGMYQRRDYSAFGEYSAACISVASFSAAIASVVVGDTKAVHAEFVDWVLPFDNAVQEHIAYGRKIWMVAAGRYLHSIGGSLTQVLAVGAEPHLDQAPVLLDVLSWPAGSNVGFDKYGVVGIAVAYLAAMYLRNPSAVVDDLGKVFSRVNSSVTPTVAEFPFPRFNSGLGFTVAPVHGDGYMGDSRILDLEQRMVELAALVDQRNKRLSDLDSDKG